MTKKHLFAAFIMLLSFSQISTAQEVPTSDFLSQLFKPTEQSNAHYTRTLESDGKEGYKVTVNTMHGSLRMTGTMVLVKDELEEHGEFIFYYDNGQVESSGYYELGVKVGAWKRYTYQGSARPDRYYKPESAEFLRLVMAGEPNE